ncbi:hypothetical protein MMC13_000695 [Lambiella insularis]|nr:hypothetical protein [Lambiella insularis]
MSTTQSLMKLPEELKMKVLENLLVSDRPIYIRTKWMGCIASDTVIARSAGKGGALMGTLVQTAILYVCKSIGTTGLEVLYGKNRFNFLCVNTLVPFLYCLSMDNIRRIQNISLAVNGNLLRSIGRFTASFPNLVSVELDMWYVNTYYLKEMTIVSCKMFERIQERAQRPCKVSFKSYEDSVTIWLLPSGIPFYRLDYIVENDEPDGKCSTYGEEGNLA